MSYIKKAISGGGVYEKTTLPDGLRVVTEKIPASRSVSIGVWIDVGSRNETGNEVGLSHFIEHMVFKGTKRRSSKQIADSLESLGGSLNAFTSREQTCYTARVLDEFTDDAIDVLADITCHARMTPVNLAREGLVICEEIKESLDSPGDHIHDLFSQTFWGDHPLGQPIMGSQENIKGMTRARMKSYMNKHYRAGSVVIAASGSISHRKLVKLVRDKFTFAKGTAGTPQKAERTVKKNVLVSKTDGNQVHHCLGFPAFSYSDRRRMAAIVLNTYLGSGMSSVLFQKVRENKGLAYSIFSYLDFFRDAGMFGTYLSTDKNKVEMAHDIVLAECRKVKRNRIKSELLGKVKAQIKGNITLAMESTSNKMHRLGRMELIMGRFQPLKSTLREFDNVTSSQILEVANDIMDESQLAVTVLGPVDSKFKSKS